MKKRRLVALGVGMMMLGSSILTGCGSGGKETSAPAEKTTATSVEAGQTEAKDETKKEEGKEDQEQITLRFVSWQSNHAKGDQRIVDAWEEKHPEIQVEIEYVGDMSSRDYLQKTDLMLMGGEEIDIIMSPSIADLSVRANSNSYLPMDEYFEAEGKTPEDVYSIIPRINDKVYSIPSDMRYNVVLINKDMLDAAGLEVPDLNWTWDEYREYAMKMTQGSGANTIYGSYMHTFGDDRTRGILSAKPDSPLFNEDGSLTFENPEFGKFLQYRYNLENVDKASTPLADIKALNMNYRDQFFSGKIAMLPMGTNLLCDIGNESYPHDFVTTFARQPLWNETDPHYNMTGAIFYSVAKTSTHPKEAFEFLRFWTTEGVPLKGMFVSNEKNVDKMESTTAIVKDFEDKVDMEALKTFMQDPDWVDSYVSYSPEYQSQIETVLTEETDKFLLGSQSLDDTIANLMSRCNAIIEENK